MFNFRELGAGSSELVRFTSLCYLCSLVIRVDTSCWMLCVGCSALDGFAVECNFVALYASR